MKENNIFYSEEAFKNHFTLVNYFQLTKISADFEQETVVFRGIGKVPIILIVWIWIDSGLRKKEMCVKANTWSLKPELKRIKEWEKQRKREWGGRTNVYLSCSGGFSIIFLKWTEQAKELLFRQRAEAEMTCNEWTHQNGIPQPYCSVHAVKGLWRKLHKNMRLEGIVVHDPRRQRVHTTERAQTSFNT